MADAPKTTTRRAVLTAAAGAAALTLTKALDHPAVVRGAGDDGAAIHVGDLFADARSQTTLANKANNERVLWVASNPDLGNGAGTAVTGYSAKGVGVEGFTDIGTGVRAVSNSGNGLYAATAGDFSKTAVWGNATANASGVSGGSNGGNGVSGYSAQRHGGRFTSDGSGFAAMVGQSRAHGTGSQGYSGGDEPPVPPTKTGVYGVAVQDSSSRGVWGHSESGRGVYGRATSGVGVYGEADAGYALRTRGRVKMGQVSGVASITGGSTSITVKPGVNVTSSSFLLLTPKANLGGRDIWFTTDPKADTFTIRMSASRSVATKIAWLLLG